jgi:hypothetical protein
VLKPNESIRSFIDRLRAGELLEFCMGPDDDWFLARLTGHELSERLWIDEKGLDLALRIVDELTAKGELERDLFCSRFKRPGVMDWAQGDLLNGLSGPLPR